MNTLSPATLARLALDAGPSGHPGGGMVQGSHGDWGRYCTLEDGRVIFITSASGMVPPRLAGRGRRLQEVRQGRRCNGPSSITTG